MKYTNLSYGLLMFAGLVQAADQEAVTLETMTVTTNKVLTPSFNREPESKTEFYGQELTERGINRLQDISKTIANFDTTNQGLGTFRQIFAMRGLTNNAIYGAPATVFYVDDIAYSSAMTNMGQLFDVDSVSVYRTAQPASFGKNAYAGAVDIHTRQPTNDFKAGLTLERGNFDYYDVGFKTSGALLKDELFFSLAGVYNQRDGFLYNSYLNNRPDDSENFSGRVTLTWKPNRTWNIRFTATKDDFDYGNGRFVQRNTPKSFTTRAGLRESLQQNSDSQSLRVAYQTEDYNFLSISSRRFWQNSPMIVDIDLRPADLVSRHFSNQNRTFTQELRLRPKHQGIWQWNVGAFYSTEQYNELDNIDFLGSRSIYQTNTQTDNYALLGHLAYQGIKQLNVYGDLRFDYVSSHMNSTLHSNDFPNGVFIPVTLTYDTFFFSPKLGFDYKLTHNSLIYASTGFGFKPGGLTYANIEPSVMQFNQEIAWQNNLGVKTTWLNERIKTNLAGFYYHVHDYQVERFFAGGNYSTFNAPRVSSYGLELENQAQLIDYLTLENSIGYTHAHFDSYHDVISHIDYSGNAVPFVPKFNAVTALQYKHPQGYFARAEWLWKGKTYYDEAETLSQHAYSLVNLRLGYEQDRYSVYAYANNLSNTYYYTTQIGTRGAPGDPRTFGVRVSLNY